MATVVEDLKNAQRYLRAAYTNLKDARTHCDGVVDVDGIHYNDVTELMRRVEGMSIICKRELDRLEHSISVSKES